MKNSLILTNAEIEKILAAEYTTVVEEREYTPWFLDSIEELEAEMACLFEVADEDNCQEEEDLLAA